MLHKTTFWVIFIEAFRRIWGFSLSETVMKRQEQRRIFFLNLQLTQTADFYKVLEMEWLLKAMVYWSYTLKFVLRESLGSRCCNLLDMICELSRS